RLDVGGVDVEIRMDAWLQSDTIRRMGFGHVVAARRHTLIVERGVSFAAFDERGVTLLTAYASNIFAPQPRYLVRFAAPRRPAKPDTTRAARHHVLWGPASAGPVIPDIVAACVSSRSSSPRSWPRRRPIKPRPSSRPRCRKRSTASRTSPPTSRT